MSHKWVVNISLIPLVTHTSVGNQLSFSWWRIHASQTYSFRGEGWGSETHRIFFLRPCRCRRKRRDVTKAQPYLALEQSTYQRSQSFDNLDIATCNENVKYKTWAKARILNKNVIILAGILHSLHNFNATNRLTILIQFMTKQYYGNG